MYSTLTEVFWYLVELLRKHSKARSAALGVGIFLLLLAGFVLGAKYWQLFPEIRRDVFDLAAICLGFSGLILSMASVVAYLPPEAVPPFLFRQEMKELRTEREAIKGRSANKPKADLFDAVQLNLNEIREYCVVNKKQAWSSFGFGVFAILVGLATLVFGVWRFYLDSSTNLTVTALVSISGILVQFIGASSLYLYLTTLRQGNFYFAHLVQMQDIMLSIRLCAETPDEAKRIVLQEKVIEALLHRTATLPALPSSKEGNGHGK